MAAAAAMPSLATELGSLVLVGAASTTFMATGNSTLQLTSAPSLRGRVMALWSITFQGSTPLGGPLIGVVSQYGSPRYALGVGAVACLLAAGLGAGALRRTPTWRRRGPRPADASSGLGMNDPPP
jgi:MFS family permease